MKNLKRKLENEICLFKCLNVNICLNFLMPGLNFDILILSEKLINLNFVCKNYINLEKLNVSLFQKLYNRFKIRTKTELIHIIFPSNN